jgi:hypothetical protein
MLLGMCFSGESPPVDSGDAIGAICDEVVDISSCVHAPVSEDMLSYICQRHTYLGLSRPSLPPIGKESNLGADDKTASEAALTIWSDWLAASSDTGEECVVTSASHEDVQEDAEEDVAYMLSTGRTRVMKRRRASASSKTLNEDVAWREVTLTHTYTHSHLHSLTHVE